MTWFKNKKRRNSHSHLWDYHHGNSRMSTTKLLPSILSGIIVICSSFLLGAFFCHWLVEYAIPLLPSPAIPVLQ
jgi:hypothetical protein